jgi:hypothetical protein
MKADELGKSETSNANQTERNIMSVIRVELDCVQVTEGAGIGEGDFELRIHVLEKVTGVGNVPRVIWPSIDSTMKVNNNGTVKRIDQEVKRYTVNSGSLSKTFLIIVEEEDTGTLGQDEVGQNSVTFELTPNMSKTTEPATITLRNQGNNEGQVKVNLVAEQL